MRAIRSRTSARTTAASENSASPARPSSSAMEQANVTENLPSKPVRGSVFPVSSSTNGCTRSRIFSMRSGAIPRRTARSRTASMAGWITTPHAYGFTPLSKICHRCPSPSTRSAGVLADDITANIPRRPCSGSGAPVNPPAASSPAQTPAAAAWPAWNGLVMVPNCSRWPAACVAAMLRQCVAVVPVKPEQPDGNGRRSEGAGGAGHVPAGVVVLGVERVTRPVRRVRSQARARRADRYRRRHAIRPAAFPRRTAASSGEGSSARACHRNQVHGKRFR